MSKSSNLPRCLGCTGSPREQWLPLPLHPPLAAIPLRASNKGSIHSALWRSNVYGLATTQCLVSLRLQDVSPSTRVRMALPHDVAAENSRNYVSHPHTTFGDIKVSCKTQGRSQ